jgi:REP element-mobilizing transposase RayT
MPRIARSQLLYDGCYAHIISRSIRKEKIFKDSEDFELFLNLLHELKDKSRFKIFHYCLMQTHFHLVVQIHSVQLFAKGLNQLKSRYIYAFHTKYKISGPIWRERYKSLLIEDERYLLACGNYVENNPVKAGLVQQVEDWKYSSGQHYLNKRKDMLVDGYNSLNITDQLDLLSEEDFEQGHGIGSDFFKFQLKGKLK